MIPYLTIRRSFFFATFFLGCLVFFPLSAQALDAPYDHSVWDTFLKKYVNEKGEVDYAGVQRDPFLLDTYIEGINRIGLNDFAEWPREEALALWLNAYHAGLIRLVTEHYPVKSVQEIPGFWELNALKLGRKGHSLNDIRQTQLLDQFQDEKIHLVLACGGVSCPPLSSEAFTGPRVEGQLFLATRQRVNNKKFVGIRPGDSNVYLSRIFKWHANDFVLDFGGPQNTFGLKDEEAAVLSFIFYYLEDYDKVHHLETADKIKLKYYPFDWALNDWKREADDGEEASA